ncbi:hypothetical protein HOLleu_01309 [Holothuria leucospilota]|uniref:C2H2-type domain-containing protein n=1 Tax=Holothuria leucospilota TaxID=206669 RepID=A0A9Q1HGC4_HOLLE|nr:hypothetical protein HOLleu_01309 [Holothuria leucospilota]
MKQHLRRVHVARKHAWERCRKIFKSQSNLKRHARPGGPCEAKRRRKGEVADQSGEQPHTSAATTPDESSSESEHVHTEAPEAIQSNKEDGVETGGGDDNREDDVLEEDPLIMTEEVRREMADMMCDVYEKNCGGGGPSIIAPGMWTHYSIFGVGSDYTRFLRVREF